MKKILNYIYHILIALGIGLSLFAVIEILRAYQTLSELHPVAGYGFLIFLFALLVYLVWQIRGFFQFDPAPRPPMLPETGPVENDLKKRYNLYLQKVYDRFCRNSYLNQHMVEDLENLNKSLEVLKQTDSELFRDTLLDIENTNIASLLVPLDNRAEKVVSDNVGIVSIGTALSPYRAVDLYIVVARNFRMVNKILRIYRTRPTLKETMLVFYDILKVVAAVNLLNSMDTVWTGLGRHVPLVGRYGEAMSEGLFSGLFTSVAGHAAIDRCRSYHPWSTEKAARKYRGRLTRWSRDIFGILKNHGLEKLNFSRQVKKSKTETEELDS